MSLAEDVQNTVESILPQSLSFSRTGGRIDQNKAFTELREIALTVLVLDPNALLYLILLARDKVLVATIKEFNLATELSTALTDLSSGATTTPIRSAEALGAAETDLANLRADLTAGFVDTSLRDNVARAQASIDLYLDGQVAPNVKSGGFQITTKDEAAQQVIDLVPQLVEAHIETLRLLFQFEKIFEEFQASDVRVLIGDSVVQGSNFIVARIREDSENDPVGAASLSSKHLAELISVKRVLDSYFNAVAPLDDRLVGDATNGLRAFAVGTGTPAQLNATSTVRPLVTIEAGASVIDITANGVATSVDLLTQGVTSTPATLLGTVGDTYAITLGVNDSFDLAMDQGTVSTITLMVGAARTAAQIASDINGTFPGVASAVLENGQTVVQIKSTVNGRDSHVFVVSGNANATLGFGDNDLESGSDPILAAVADGLNQGQAEYRATSVTPIPATTTLLDKSVASSGSLTATIFTDGSVADFTALGIEGGDTIQILSGPNTGEDFIIERVTAGQLHIFGALDDSSIDYQVINDNRELNILSLDDSTVSKLDVDSGDGNARVGFDGTETNTGTTSFIQIKDTAIPGDRVVDTELLNVIPGDEVTLTGTFNIVEHTALSDEPVIQLDAEIPNDTSSVFFTIKSEGAIAFRAVIDDPIDASKPIPSFIRVDLTKHGFDVNLSAIEGLVNRAVNDTTVAADAILVVDDLKDLLDDLTGLQFRLKLYVAEEAQSLKDLFDALQEHNFDRFLKLLCEGFITDALAVDSTNFSFSAQLQAAALEVNREDLRV